MGESKVGEVLALGQSQEARGTSLLGRVGGPVGLIAPAEAKSGQGC